MAPTSAGPSTPPANIQGDNDIFPADFLCHSIPDDPGSASAQASSLLWTSTSLASIVSPSELRQVVQLYFDYVYCLAPCLEPASLWQDLEARRDARPDQDEWTHMVLALVASTLVQIPTVFCPLSDERCADLVRDCWRRVRDFIALDVSQCSAYYG